MMHMDFARFAIPADATPDELREWVNELYGAWADASDAMDRAGKFAADMSGSCPLDMFDFRAKDCDEECDDSYAECWRRYFMGTERETGE